MRRSKFIVFLILCIWFVISFVTNILGPIMPAIIENYQLSLTMAAFLPFSFFLAYGIMSAPAGALIEKFGEKVSMLIAFGLNLAGAFVFSLFPIYEIALISLFIIGIGMAMLQVIINPLMREAGGEENFAFYSVMGQLVFGAASFVSPQVFTYLMRELDGYQGGGNLMIDTLSKLIPAELPWSSLYWLFTLVFIVVIIVISMIKLPKVELKEDEKAGAFKTYLELLKDKRVILFFLGIMAYVGTEQGLANWMSKFLNTYHGIDPEGAGATAISWFWGLMSLGCLLGLVLLKLLDSKLVLKLFTVTSMIAVAVALFGSGSMSLIAFPAAGFFISVMFSIIFSLALNSVKNHHGAFSGILCSGIFGGALVPLIIGALGDILGLKMAMMFLFVTLGYIMSVAYWAKPLVDNKVVSVKELFASLKK
ncbi:MFS transporter [Puteibacter caeruleilacunae]|nr:MFS transporter [Puteibacter caeruleilacunae]